MWASDTSLYPSSVESRLEDLIRFQIGTKREQLNNPATRCRKLSIENDCIFSSFWFLNTFGTFANLSFTLVLIFFINRLHNFFSIPLTLLGSIQTHICVYAISCYFSCSESYQPWLILILILFYQPCLGLYTDTYLCLCYILILFMFWILSTLILILILSTLLGSIYKHIFPPNI